MTTLHFTGQPPHTTLKIYTKFSAPLLEESVAVGEQDALLGNLWTLKLPPQTGWAAWLHPLRTRKAHQFEKELLQKTTEQERADYLLGYLKQPTQLKGRFALDNLGILPETKRADCLLKCLDAPNILTAHLALDYLPVLQGDAVKATVALQLLKKLSDQLEETGERSTLLLKDDYWKKLDDVRQTLLQSIHNSAVLKNYYLSVLNTCLNKWEKYHQNAFDELEKQLSPKEWDIHLPSLLAKPPMVSERKHCVDSSGWHHREYEEERSPVYGLLYEKIPCLPLQTQISLFTQKPFEYGQYLLPAMTDLSQRSALMVYALLRHKNEANQVPRKFVHTCTEIVAKQDPNLPDTRELEEILSGIQADSGKSKYCYLSPGTVLKLERTFPKMRQKLLPELAQLLK